MKCPYRKIVEKVKTDNTETLVEDFCECLKFECPRYICGRVENGIFIEDEQCRKVENEYRYKN